MFLLGTLFQNSSPKPDSPPQEVEPTAANTTAPTTTETTPEKPAAMEKSASAANLSFSQDSPQEEKSADDSSDDIPKFKSPLLQNLLGKSRLNTKTPSPTLELESKKEGTESVKSGESTPTNEQAEESEKLKEIHKKDDEEKDIDTREVENSGIKSDTVGVTCEGPMRDEGQLTKEKASEPSDINLSIVNGDSSTSSSGLSNGTHTDMTEEPLVDLKSMVAFR